MIMPKMPGMDFEFSFGSPWGDLELASLNADLGEYFGTRDGVLVVRAPADSGLPLKGGDVILSIGGREPASAPPAVGVLRSYGEGGNRCVGRMREQNRGVL